MQYRQRGPSTRMRSQNQSCPPKKLISTKKLHILPKVESRIGYSVYIVSSGSTFKFPPFLKMYYFQYYLFSPENIYIIYYLLIFFINFQWRLIYM